MNSPNKQLVFESEYSAQSGSKCAINPKQQCEKCGLCDYIINIKEGLRE